MSKLNETRNQIAELQDEVAAIVNLAEGEDRELSNEENQTIDSNLDVIGEGGEAPTGLRQVEARLERVEAEKARIALARAPQPVEAPAKVYATPKVHHNLRAFKGENAARNAYHAGMWLKAQLFGHEDAKQFCNDNGLKILGAQSGNVNTAGGFLVPDPLSDSIIDVIENTSAIRQLANVIAMPSDTLSIPKRVSGLTVDYTSENASITDSSKVWASVSLAVKRQSCLTKISNELVQDSVIDVADDIATEIGRAFAIATSSEAIVGDGSGTYGSETGMVSFMGAGSKVTLDSGETSQSDVALADLNSLVGKLPDQYHSNASWLVSRSFYANVIQKLIYAAGGNTHADISAGSAHQLMGYNLFMADEMPADAAGACVALFGSFSDGLIIGEREGISLAISDAVYFADNAIGVRGIARNDVACHSFDDASSAGSICGLFTAAS